MGTIRRAALAAALILVPQLAGAADMLPPPPPLEPPPLRGTVVPEFSGWYLRGDVGLGATTNEDWKVVPTTPAANTTLSEGIRNTSLSASPFIGFGIGYAVNSWFRFDITGEYRSMSAHGVYNGLENSTINRCTLLSTTGVCTLYQNDYPGKISSAALMLNGYFDLGTWYGITPYVGAGVGIARNTMSGFTDSGLNVSGTGLNSMGLPVVGGVATQGGPTGVVAISPIRDRSTYSLAYALMAGLSYDVSQNLKLEFGYRYMNMGSAKSGLIDCLCAQVYDGFKVSKVASHDLRIGMRWMLGDAGQLAPIPMAPLVRKY
jgi:opacity protein-like surface antigen